MFYGASSIEDIVSMDDGSRFVGGIEDDKMEGFGVLDKGTELYIGSFHESKPNGYLKYYKKGKLFYDGNWKDGAFWGEGTLYKEDGSIKSGEWNNGTLIQTLVDKNLPEGHYYGYVRNGKPDGLGKMNYANSSLYVGKWHAGKWHGQGLYVHGADSIYGEWKSGKICGDVIYRTPQLFFEGFLVLQVLKFFQLLNVLFQEHQAEADEEQQAGKPDGPAAHGGQCKAAEAGPQREQEDYGEVVHRLAEGFGVAAHQPCAEGIHGAAQIADAHGAGERVAVHLAERLHLHRAGKRHQRIGGHIKRVGDEPDAEQQQNFHHQHQLPPVEPLHLLEFLAQQFRREHAQRKEAQRHQIVQHRTPVALDQLHAAQHDVAGLCIGKHLAAI